ncbi:MAG: sugar phosphate isomerase/epimerase, partial [Ktedonobacteraceae bacterium]|nr:sugar phosphate isomerase/epimerase [Ktedonobacteraceae bacterium]
TNILNTVAEGGALIAPLAEAGITHARLLADTYHMASNQEDPASIQPYLPLIKHVHVAELRDRAAPGYYGEDFRPYFAVLKRGNYDQRISIECNWQDLPAQLGSALATVREQWETSLQS